MDVIEEDRIKDLRNPANQIQFNHSTMAHINTGIVNRALCVKGDSDIVLLENARICSSEICVFAVWLKHHCNNGSNRIIFITPMFSVICSDNDTSSVKILYKSCYYIVSAKIGFWYHLSIGMNGDKVDVYINGDKVEYLQNCHVTQSNHINSIVVGASKRYTCLDELFVYSTAKTDNEIKQLYNLTVFGKFTLSVVMISYCEGYL